MEKIKIDPGIYESIKNKKVKVMAVTTNKAVYFQDLETNKINVLLIPAFVDKYPFKILDKRRQIKDV